MREIREVLKLVIVGHVDHGKSTLIGRLLNDTGSLPEGKLEELKTISARRGMPLEWSFVLDAFQAERDQAITIDTTQIWFKTPKRDVVIIDAPGHREFLKNMVSGAAAADAAILVIDAEEGVREQTRRHGYLLHLLGIRQVAVAINKMDLVDYAEGRFSDLLGEITAYLGGLGIVASTIIPVAAREGGNVAQRAAAMAWYEGPTLLEALDQFRPVTTPTDLPLRLPVQDVYHFDERRILVGRLESGTLTVGDRLLISPGNQTARVRAIEGWHAPQPVAARAGQSVGITLEEQIFVERGDVASHESRPPILSNVFRATLFWLGRTPLSVGKRYRLKLATRETQVTVTAIERIIDTDTLGSLPGERVERNMVAEVVLRSRGLLALDEYRALPRTGRFVVIEDFETVGGGVISMEGYPDQRESLTVRSTNLYSVEHGVSQEARHLRHGHLGGVLWLTGLSGAGKSTVAMRLEQLLFRKGYQVYVLDGDNVRRGLNSNLGFSPQDRAENIRRVGEAAALFADAGFICVTSFISPYQADRDRARSAAERTRSGAFHEVYVKAELATCEKRDPKGLYRRARAGEIPDFTGVSAPYEAPQAPELVVDTEALDVEGAARLVLDYIEEVFVKPAAETPGN